MSSNPRLLGQTAGTVEARARTQEARLIAWRMALLDALGPALLERAFGAEVRRRKIRKAAVDAQAEEFARALEGLLRRSGTRQLQAGFRRVSRQTLAQANPQALKKWEAFLQEVARSTVRSEEQALLSTADKILRGELKVDVGRGQSLGGKILEAHRQRRGTLDLRYLARNVAATAEHIGRDAGHEAEGVQLQEWLAYSSPRWPRRHDRLDGEIRRRGDPFVMPRSGARLMYPHDPAAPKGEVINCRCSLAAVYPGTPAYARAVDMGLVGGGGVEPDPRPPPPTFGRPEDPEPEPPELEAEVPPVDLEPRGEVDDIPWRAARVPNADDPNRRTAPRWLTQSRRSEAQPPPLFELDGLGDAVEREDPDALEAHMGALLERWGIPNAKLLEPQGGVRVRDLPADAAGVNLWTGAIEVTPEVMRLARRAARKLRARRELDYREADAIRVLVHEQIHSTRTVGRGGYRGVGRVIEEVTTETAARSILRRESMFRLAPDATANQMIGPRGAYGSGVEGMRAALESVIDGGPSQSRDLLEAASLNFRRRPARQATPTSLEDPESAARAWEEDIERSAAELGIRLKRGWREDLRIRMGSIKLT